MNFTKTLNLISAMSLLASSTIEAAPLRANYFDSQPNYSISSKLEPRKLEVKHMVKNTCASEGYECASGFNCDLIMTRSGEDAFGRQVQTSGANLRFYRCELNGGSSRPSCSKGLIPSGIFYSTIQGDLRGIPGVVREYLCQIPL